MNRLVTAATTVAGVVGEPVRHSLSPLIHNAWIEAAGVDAVYVAFSPPQTGFRDFVLGLRGGAIRGLNVTLPFKEIALELADRASDRARAAGAANLLVFEPDGAVTADNTDGQGLLDAFAVQAPGFDPRSGPVTILGAGGAARGAAAAFVAAGAAQVRIVNRTLAKAAAVAEALGPAVRAYGVDRIGEALDGVAAVVNATSTGLTGGAVLAPPLELAPKTAVAMDMVYKPLVTPFLVQAQAQGLRVVDGLEMLIRQAAPSFEAFFGRSPPNHPDVRALALAALEAET
jgi:shikimate dehydrogenase